MCPGQVTAVYPGERPRRLGRSQHAAIAEHGRKIERGRLLELPIMAGDRTKAAGPVEPVFGVTQGVENPNGRDLGADRRFEPGQQRWLGLLRGWTHHRLARLNPHRHIGGQRLIGCVGARRQARLEVRHKGRPLHREPHAVAIRSHLGVVRLPGNQLRPKIGEEVAAHHGEIAALE